MKDKQRAAEQLTMEILAVIQGPIEALILEVFENAVKGGQNDNDKPKQNQRNSDSSS